MNTIRPFLLVAVCLAHAFADEAPLVLQNDTVRIAIDPRNGAIRELISRTLGWETGPRAPTVGSFRLHLPLPGHRSHLVRGEDMPPPRAQLASDGQALTLTWDSLTDADERPLPVRIATTFTLVSNSVRVDTEIANGSAHVLEAFEFSALDDLGARFPAGAIHRQHLSYAQLATAEIRPTFVSERGYWGVDHPVQVTPMHESPFQLVTNHRQGFYLGFHSAAPEFFAEFVCTLSPGWSSELRQDVPKGDAISQHPVRLDLHAIQFPFLGPGETTRLTPLVIAPYRGGWGEGLASYQTWRAGPVHRRAPPAWADDIHSWQQIRMNSSEDRVLFRYRDLATLAADCARHGVSAIQVTGWNLGGQDRNNPSHDTDPRLGTPDELRGAIAEAHKLGVKIVLFSKFTWADRSTAWYRDELKAQAIRDPYGDPYFSQGYRYDTPTQLADINTRRFAPLCPLDARWRALAAREMAKIVALGADGTLFDESQHHGTGNLCFAADHGHPVPGFTHAGNAALAGALRSAFPADRDFLLAGEALQDAQWQDYSLSYFRLRRGADVPQRYLEPFAPIMVAVTGYDDREMINEAVRLRLILSYEPRNFKGRLDDFPLTIAYGKRVDDFRRRHRDFLWDGEYRATEGADVRVENQPHSAIAIFRRPDGRRALVIVNSQDAPIAPIVALAGARGPLTIASPEEPTPVPLTVPLIVPARSLVTLFEP